MNIKFNKAYSLNNKEFTINKKSENTLSIETYNAILDVLQQEEVFSVNKYFDSVHKSLNRQSIDWSSFLPKHKKLEYVNYLKEKMHCTEKYFTQYFFDTFPKRLSLFRYMKPLKDSEVPVYKHSSVTGRLSIEKGINYLTMRKDVRNDLRSPFKDHSILEVDFKSCEPNLYARHFGLIDENERDMYAHLAEKIGISIADRDKLKRVVLSVLYGANMRSVSKMSKIDIKKIKQIKSILRIEEFESSLKDEYAKSGFIKNLYGRPILSDSNLVNYWIQSSAVDYCCLSFLKFFKHNSHLKLHAIIHDAALFSSPNSEIDNLLAIDNLGDDNLDMPIEIKLIG